MPQTTSAKPVKSVSLTPRAMEALWRAVESLEASDPKRLASVLVEIASDEIEQNSRFASSVRVLYNALEPVKKATTTTAKSKKTKRLPEDLVPMRHVNVADFDLGAPPDPYFLLEVFGAEQFPRVLKEYSPAALKEAVEIVQEHQPGTQPLKQTKPSLIEYIVTHVV